jgi:hypothetical protein
LLAIENDLLYSVIIHPDHSLFTLISHASEIQKIEVQMRNSKNSHYLNLHILPKIGKKISFLIRSIKFFYSNDDWKKIPEFLRVMDFQSEPKDIRLEDVQNLHNRRYRYFNSHDNIFRLFENPKFAEELKLVEIKTINFIFVLFGIVGLIISPIFALVTDPNSIYVFLIIVVLSVLFLAYGCLKIIKHRKRQKTLVKKYGIGFYFK